MVRTSLMVLSNKAKTLTRWSFGGFTGSMEVCKM